MEEYNNVQRLGETRNNVYWILYQTVNLQNNKIYIGVHKTKDPFKFDGYIGCGVYINQPSSYMYSKTKFQAAVKKYGTAVFKRTVLKIYQNEEDAYLEESRIVDPKFLERPDVYNMICGGKIPNYMYNTVKVHQYDLQGKYLKTFNSIEEASIAVQRDASSVSEAASVMMSCGGYYWSSVRQSQLDLTAVHSVRKYKTIYQYSAETGEFLQEFPSTRATGYSQASQSAILGNMVDNKYYFCYVKANTYSQARDSYLKGRTIYQYDSEGKFLKEWLYLEALKKFSKDGINQAIRHKTLTKSGFYWGLQKYSCYNKPVKTQNKSIGKYNMKNELLAVYATSSECYKINGKGVYKCLVGIRKSYKGFKYQYIE